jgi:sulfur carrier protein
MFQGLFQGWGMIEITVNGEKRSMQDKSSLSELLRDLGVQMQIVVIEKNGVIVAQDEFDQEIVAGGDTLEIVRLVGGG